MVESGGRRRGGGVERRRLAVRQKRIEEARGVVVEWRGGDKGTMDGGLGGRGVTEAGDEVVGVERRRHGACADGGHGGEDKVGRRGWERRDKEADGETKEVNKSFRTKLDSQRVLTDGSGKNDIVQFMIVEPILHTFSVTPTKKILFLSYSNNCSFYFFWKIFI